MVVAERSKMAAEQEVESEIKDLLSTEQRPTGLQRKLFAPDGLFGKLARSQEERSLLVQTPLFREAQKRITELERNDELQRQTASAERSTATAVFTVIGSRLFSRAAEISAFACTGYSFEEWSMALLPSGRMVLRGWVEIC